MLKNEIAAENYSTKLIFFFKDEQFLFVRSFLNAAHQDGSNEYMTRFHEIWVSPQKVQYSVDVVAKRELNRTKACGYFSESSESADVKKKV